MKQIHTREKQQFKKLFKDEHIDDFEEKFKILEVFLQTERHITTSEFVQLLSENGYHFEPDLSGIPLS
jgi:Fur family ferric uptake transcriptional regulator